MNLLSAAERFASMDRSSVTLDSQRCLHTQDRFSTCQACYDLCPVEAIQPGKPPTLVAEKCQSCLACLITCPTGAYIADDAVPALLNCTSRLENGQVELLCSFHPSIQIGISEEIVGVRIRGCLAGLGSSAYLALAAIGIHHSYVRVDGCAKCPWVNLKAQIQQQTHQAQVLLGGWGKDQMVSCVSELSEGTERPLWDADNPPLSRRDLFRMAAKQGQVAIARAMTADQPTGEKIPGRNYLRIAGAVKHLPPVTSSSEFPLVDTGYATLTINEECTACNACGRVCPTQALKFEMDVDKTKYKLEFSPLSCVGCEACAHVCAPQAICIEHTPLFNQVFASQEPILLREGGLTRCAKCNAIIADRPGVNLCSVCEYRQNNPFGSMLPPGLKSRMEKINKESTYDH